MNRWDEILNQLNDDEWAWWPFTFLRPAKHERMSTRVVLAISVLYGLFAGMFANVLFALAGSVLAKSPLIFPIAVPMVLFVLHRLTFARAWNRRAARLSVLASMEREEA